VNVTKSYAGPLVENPIYTVELTQAEAIRLLYGLNIGKHTQAMLLLELNEVVGLPECFAPTDEVLQDRAPDPIDGFESEFRP
jgi:hypothetical protein